MALNYAAKYPHRVKSVISIGGFANGRAKGLDGMLQFLSKGRIFRKALFHAGWATMRLHPLLLKGAVMLYAYDWRALLQYTALDETLALIYPDVKQHPVEAIRLLFRYLLGMNVMDEMHAITMPVLSIVGDRDPVIPYEHQVKYTEALPQGRLLCLSQTGHVALAERDQRVHEAMVNWLQEHETK